MQCIPPVMTTNQQQFHGACCTKHFHSQDIFATRKHNSHLRDYALSELGSRWRAAHLGLATEAPTMHNHFHVEFSQVGGDVKGRQHVSAGHHGFEVVVEGASVRDNAAEPPSVLWRLPAVKPHHLTLMNRTPYLFDPDSKSHAFLVYTKYYHPKP